MYTHMHIHVYMYIYIYIYDIVSKPGSYPCSIAPRRHFAPPVTSAACWARGASRLRLRSATYDYYCY